MRMNKLISCLDYLGIKPSMKSFNDRKKMQKISYLFPVFDLDIGFSTDDFNWYLHGPYSPDLTRTMFRLLENPTNGKTALKKSDVNKLENLKKFLGSDINSVDSLELLVSLHFLLNEAKKTKSSTDTVIEILKEKKPYFKYKQIKSALRKLETLS